MLPREHILLTSLGVWVFVMLTGCSTTPEELCTKKIPQWGRDIQLAQIQIRELAQDRGIASEKESLPDEEFREGWESWAEDRLKRLQEYIDITAEDPQLREVTRSLNDAANELVAFYGYATEGRMLKMTASLERIERHQEKIEKRICEAPPRDGRTAPRS